MDKGKWQICKTPLSDLIDQYLNQRSYLIVPQGRIYSFVFWLQQLGQVDNGVQPLQCVRFHLSFVLFHEPENCEDKNSTIDSTTV